MVLDEAEKESLVRDLGGGEALILRNHGALVVGRTAGEAFNWTHRLELACRSQIAAMSCNTQLREVPQQSAGGNVEQLPARHATSLWVDGVGGACCASSTAWIPVIATDTDSFEERGNMNLTYPAARRAAPLQPSLPASPSPALRPSRRRVTIRIVRSVYWSPSQPAARPTSSRAP